MEVESATFALRWTASWGNSHTTHTTTFTDSTSLLQKDKNGMGSPDWHVSVVDIHLRKLWLHSTGHTGVMENDRADRLAGKATTTSSFRPGRPWVLRSLRHYVCAQTIAWKEDALDHFPWERAVVSHTNTGTVLKATLGKPESRGGAHSPEFQIPSGTGMNKAVKFDVGQNSHVFANYATRKGVVKRAAHSVH